jgi:hypothetical protein
MEGLGYKIYIDNYFISPALFDDPLTCEHTSLEQFTDTVMEYHNTLCQKV